jgi:hypothetical protein
MMSIRKLVCGALAALCLPLVTACREPEFLARDATPCDLARNPDDYVGHLVHVKAFYVSDGLSVRSMIDDHCPSVVLQVTDDDLIKKNYEYNTLEEEIDGAQHGKAGMPTWTMEMFASFQKSKLGNGELILTRIVAFHRVADRTR